MYIYQITCINCPDVIILKENFLVEIMIIISSYSKYFPVGTKLRFMRFLPRFFLCQ